MEELKNIEGYFLRSKYPAGYTKADKANLRCKCRNNCKIDEGTLYYRKNVSHENEPWRICVHSQDEKQRVLERCHCGFGGDSIAVPLFEMFLASCIFLIGCHLG